MKKVKLNETKILYAPVMDTMFKTIQGKNPDHRPPINGALAVFEDLVDCLQTNDYKRIFIVFAEVKNIPRTEHGVITEFTGRYVARKVMSRIHNYPYNQPGVAKGYFIASVKRSILSFFYRWKMRRGVKKMQQAYATKAIPFPMHALLDMDGELETCFTRQKKKEAIKSLEDKKEWVSN